MTENVLRHHHDRLPTFGVGKDHQPPYWRGLIRQLIAMRALDVDTAGHGGLFLQQDEARPILRGEVRVMLRQDRPKRPNAAARPERQHGAEAGAASGAPAVAAAGNAGGLFEALRAWRAAIARAQGVPPYVIFHDTVLREIAAVRPESLDELGQIKGVGASKLQRYGADVLGVVTG
jgi:ATP-dependent DNA helicase RecQ